MSYECDVCHQTPCQTRSFCKRCRADERRDPGNRPLPPQREQSGVAESTMEAMRYVKANKPDELPAWLKRHPEVS